MAEPAQPNVWQNVRLDAIFHALSDTTRREILRDVATGEKTMNEVARPYRLTLAAVSKHVKVLEEAELVARERRGSFHLVKLKADRLREAEEWISFYERFWTERLDAMAKFLEGEEG